MKKLFLSLIIAAASFQFAAAQTAMTATNGLTLDTVTNTETVNLTSKVKGDGAVTVVLNVTKISGTVGGTATLQGSLDGTNYASLATSYTITDATQTTKFELDKRRYVFYRLAVVGTGTMSASVKAQIIVN